MADDRLIERLRAEEARMQTLYDYICTLRDKQTTPSSAFTDFNQLKHAVSGRDPVMPVAADRLEAMAQTIMLLREGLEYYADRDGEGKEWLVTDKNRDPITDVHAMGYRARRTLDETARLSRNQAAMPPGDDGADMKGSRFE